MEIHSFFEIKIVKLGSKKIYFVSKKTYQMKKTFFLIEKKLLFFNFIIDNKKGIFP